MIHAGKNSDGFPKIRDPFLGVPMIRVLGHSVKGALIEAEGTYDLSIEGPVSIQSVDFRRPRSCNVSCGMPLIA